MTASAVAAAIARHKEVVASGAHLFSALRVRDVEVDGADLAVELDLDDSLAAACQLAFTVVTPRKA